MNYYTSDLHLGHANIIRFCKRPFADVGEMDRILIENWNARVRPHDHVYIVGDLAFKNEQSIANVLDRLMGHKHLVVGNHDGKWMKQVNLTERFESVDMLLQISDDQRKLVLCHYPMMTWPGKNAYLIYGHIHNNTNGAYWPLLRTYDHALNASVEVNGYQPVTFEELTANNEVWRRTS